jgi:Leucine-rich repeat (LRR) protein
MIHETPAVPGRVPALMRLAGTLWIATGLFGVWWGLVWQWGILAFGHARDASPIPLQLLCLGFATVYLGVRLARGKQRSVLLALAFASFYAGLLSASLMSRRPYELLLWAVTAALGAPVAPQFQHDAPGRAVWLVAGAIVLAGFCSLVALPRYRAYRRQNPEGVRGLRPVVVALILLLIVPLAFAARLYVLSLQFQRRFPDQLETKLKQFREIQNPQAVTSLDLSFCALKDEDLERLRTFPALTRLNVAGPALTDARMKQIAELSNLEELNLDVTEVSDVGLQELPRLKKLKVLSLSRDLGTDRGLITDNGIRQIARLPELTQLNLNNNDGIQGKNIGELQKLTKLSQLDLTLTRVTGAWLRELSGLNELSALSLRQTGISDADLKMLHEFKNLSDLNLSRTSVTDAGMKEVGRLAKLTSLRLGETKVGDAGIKELRGLAHLKRLDLVVTKVTDAAVGDLVELKGLEELNLIRTKVTDQNLNRLGGLPNLRVLQVSGTPVTAIGADNFRKQFPRVKVERSFSEFE